MTTAETDLHSGERRESDAAADESAEFADFFAAGWALGAGGGFFEHVLPRMDPQVVLDQPLGGELRGHAGVRALFEPLFRAIPDLRGEVVRWGRTDDGVLIELTLRGTLGGRPLEWTVVDRIVLRDGIIVARRSYFDPLPLALPLLRSPRVALALLRARRGR